MADVRKVQEGYRKSVDSYNLGETKIEGKVHKPTVFYVLARSDFEYAALDLSQSFIHRIMKGARKAPF